MLIENPSSEPPATAATSAAGAWAALTELLLTCSSGLRDELTARSQREALTGPQFALLWACENGNGGLSQRELALRLSLSAAHVSGLVEQLGARGLIVGERAAHDRRRQLWRLTDSGRDAVGRVVADLEPFGCRLNLLLSTDAREQLESVLRKLATALQSAPALPEFPTSCAIAAAGGVV
jgi:DNA-binding MarR family transcriptional regulator